MKRQKFRKLILIISLLLFPITIYYFSPVLVINAGIEGIINGSFIVFVILLISSIFFGRSFCGYICPAGGLQECAFAVNGKVPKQGWRKNIKYFIWGAWIIAVVLCYLNKGQIIKIDFFYQTVNGISIANIYGYIIYYGIILLILLPAIVHGRRAFCHYFCWMAPFMVTGIKLRNLFQLPGIKIAAEKDKCISCKKCNNLCPMGIDVVNMIEKGKWENIDCVQCGACIDGCPKKVLSYRIKKYK